MFEITADDITLLNDEQLRAVVARLSEAEVRRRGYSASYVTWGGHQNAVDGGIDVRIALPTGSTTDGFIPRVSTGFQVKQMDMPPSAIRDEMCPNGLLRQAIQALAKVGGAYIIASSDASTADLSLTSRRAAMREVMRGAPNGDALCVDFYDSSRLATWVRSHEGLIPWVRSLIGRSIPGWQSYGGWAYVPDPIHAEYLIDDTLRIHGASKTAGPGFSALQGIQQMRNELRQAQRVVRLVGLSGVGKTRLVQALFDDRVGADSLDPAVAIYTNMADDPEPKPVRLASDLVTAGTRAILIVDNCPAELHQRLSDVCRQPTSNVSVLTVEYDIREDEPEGTEVFRLEPSSPELIETLLRRRFPRLSQIDAHRIAAADFCGGNARIAIALAATVGRHETVAGLTDDQLFQRLFEQRQAHDPSLFLTAQGCALVYSFQGEDLSNDEGAELFRLGNLIAQTPHEVYRNVAELQRRDLVQRRGPWRAVLPHAIANRLAALALQNIPYREIERLIFTSPRLMRSLSRRLGYLHVSTEAVAIVRKWLDIGGLLGDIGRFNDLGRAMFNNVAPAAPEEALFAIERAVRRAETAGNASEFKPYDELLHRLAYDAGLFQRCTVVLVSILTAEELDPRAHGIDVFTSLFHLVLSGTRARIEQRIAVIESLLDSPNRRRQALGILAMKAVLEAWHFMAVGGFEFGARSRDFGLWPQTAAEVRHWFTESLKLVEKAACREGALAVQVRVALAEKLRGLWLRGESPDEIVRVCQSIRRIHFWPEGWLAVRQILDLDGASLAPDNRSLLTILEAELRPSDLAQRVRAVVFSPRTPTVDLDDFEDHSGESIEVRMARTESLARDLGKMLSCDAAALDLLLPEIVASDGRLWFLGEGLSEGAGDPAQMWDRLVEALAAIDASARKPQVLRGFLFKLSQTNPELATLLLDNAVEHDILGLWYPFIQTAVNLDASDVTRLQRSVSLGKAPASVYRALTGGRVTHSIPASDLRDLLLSIAALPSGYDVALEILSMRLFSYESAKQTVPPEIMGAGRELIRRVTFTSDQREDRQLGDIAKACLSGSHGANVAGEICYRIRSAVAAFETNAFYHDDLLTGILKVQATTALDIFFGGNGQECATGVRVMRDLGNMRQPLAFVPEGELLRWCDHDPAVRYRTLAQVIQAYEKGDGKKPPRWTSIALRFLERAPDPTAILREFVVRFPEGGWSGSLASALQANIALLDQLDALPALQSAVHEERERLEQWIEESQHRESVFDRQRDERFE